MINNISDAILNSDSILLLTHKDPDGDAIGSILSFYHYLISINKSVDMVALNIPNSLSFLPSVNNIVDNVDKDYDLGIVFDCASEERIGQNSNLLSRCKKTIAIDHHISNTKYCDINMVNGNISSCCQIVYYLLIDLKISFNMNILTCLMSGVLTDTNGFSINSVDKETFSMAADIVSYGVNIHELYDKLLCHQTMAQYNLMKTAIDRLEFLLDGRVAITYITNDDFDKFGALYGDHEGIVDIGRNIDGVMVSAFLRENEGTTISLRSAGIVDVSKIAMSLGGGGHFMAAGAKFDRSIQETKEILLNEIKKVIKQ